MTKFSELDLKFMRHALSLAKKAAELNEVPVGAVLVKENKIIGEGLNCPIQFSDPTAHAEIIALRSAAKKINNYRLIDTTLYVTLEPCIMCLGAMIHARIKRLVFGALDPKFGATQKIIQFSNSFNHQMECVGGVMEEECAQLLKDFFKGRRD